MNRVFVPVEPGMVDGKAGEPRVRRLLIIKASSNFQHVNFYFSGRVHSHS